jgi:uncharacterized protein
VSDSPVIVDNIGKNRFELNVGDLRAELVYRVDRDRLIIIHTGVPEDFDGRGIGGKLVNAALDRAVLEGLTVVPECPFAAWWLRRHLDAAARVSIDWTSVR